jgi:hypothetical protein
VGIAVTAQGEKLKKEQQVELRVLQVHSALHHWDLESVLKEVKDVVLGDQDLLEIPVC